MLVQHIVIAHPHIIEETIFQNNSVIMNS